MSQNLTRVIEEHFQSLPYPRKVTMNLRHQFIDILVIAICALICGADSWVAVAEFGIAKEKGFRTFLELPSVLPSHDTFTNVESYPQNNLRLVSHHGQNQYQSYLMGKLLLLMGKH